MAKILVIEDEVNLRIAIRRTLTKSFHEVEEAGCLKDAREFLSRRDFDLVLTDVQLGPENGLDLLRELRSGGFEGVLVAMTAYGTVEAAVGAMRDGADDYLQKPISLEELSLQVERWLEQRRVSRRLKLYERMEQTREQSHELLGTSPAWKSTMAMAERLARVPLTSPTPGAGSNLPCILLLGPTGVGKGMLARYIHQCACASPNTSDAPTTEGALASKPAPSQPPFVHVNCSALPPTLVEAELFGHEKGAFTDAREARAGLFEMADGGTIFLDEVSETPLEFQAKLLLVVERGTFRRVGGSRERSVRVRIIAASNQDLEHRVAAGAFRRDLLYRLNALTIRIPSLKERAGDARVIADAMLPRMTRHFGRTGLTLSAAARAAIDSHDWQGNVRELVNALQRAVMLSEGPEIEAADLGLVSAAAGAAGGSSADRAHGLIEARPGLPGTLVFDFEGGIHTADEVERELIVQALAKTGGNVSRAARLIGMQRSSLRYRIDRYNLDGHTKEAARS